MLVALRRPVGGAARRHPWRPVLVRHDGAEVLLRVARCAAGVEFADARSRTGRRSLQRDLRNVVGERMDIERRDRRRPNNDAS
jgi:hypothetical protein